MGGKEKKSLKKIAASVSGKVEKVGNKAKKSVSSLKLVSRRIINANYDLNLTE